jgi:hypothetical protein
MLLMFLPGERDLLLEAPARKETVEIQVSIKVES